MVNILGFFYFPRDFLYLFIFFLPFTIILFYVGYKNIFIYIIPNRIAYLLNTVILFIAFVYEQ